MTALFVPAILPALFLFSAGCDVIKARELAREGNEAYLALDYRTAIEKYKQAQKLDPETPNLYLNLGYSYFSIFNPTSKNPLERNAAGKAVWAFEQHLNRNPDDDAARVFEIKTLLKAAPSDKKMADKALSTFLDMLKHNPQDHEARQYLITLFIDCHRYQDAVEFFKKDLEAKPDDVQTMKILAIIADKSEKSQDALEWYWRRAEVMTDQEKKALMFYEVGTYVWNLLHYQPDRMKGIEALKFADQGLEACRRAMALKDKYAEAMIYANLLFLKRALYETDEQSKAMDQYEAFELRKAAGLILKERKEKQKAEAPGKAIDAADKDHEGTSRGDSAGDHEKPAH